MIPTSGKLQIYDKISAMTLGEICKKNIHKCMKMMQKIFPAIVYFEKGCTFASRFKKVLNKG
jgi:hypothetical protein